MNNILFTALVIVLAIIASFSIVAKFPVAQAESKKECIRALTQVHLEFDRVRNLGDASVHMSRQLNQICELVNK